MPEEEDVRVGSSEVSEFLRRAFLAVGASEDQSSAVVNQLVWTSLRGVDSHGITLAERYLEGIKNGEINTRSKERILSESASTAVLDADRGLGAYVATRATNLAIKKAKKSGIGAVSLTNLTHCGALSYYGFLAAEEKMASIAFTNSAVLSAPWGGYTPVFGTNPFCFAFPYTRTHHVILDAATTVAAGQKIVFAIRDGKPIPQGWALDREGNSTTDPKEAMQGALLPFGGHKGYGLMLASEVYSSILGGGKPSYTGSGRYFQGGFYIQAIDVGTLRNYGEYEEEFRALIAKIRESKVAHGHEKIYIPGEIEQITAKKREKEGIPVDHETWTYLTKIQRDLDLPQLRPFKVARSKGKREG